MRNGQAAEPEERAVGDPLHRPQGEAVRPPVVGDADHERIALAARERRREEGSDLGVGVHGGERVQVAVAPFPQDETRGFQPWHPVRVGHARMVADPGPILRPMPDEHPPRATPIRRPTPRRSTSGRRGAARLRSTGPRAAPPGGLGLLRGRRAGTASRSGTISTPGTGTSSGPASSWTCHRSSLETTILGRPAAMPIGVAPAALHGLAHPDGELATARAAAAAGAINVVSTVASRRSRRSPPPPRRRPPLVPALRPAGLGRHPRPRRAGGGRRLRGARPHRGRPVLGYRDDVLRRTFDPDQDAYAQPAQARRGHRGGELDELLDMRSVRAHLGHAGGDPLLGAAAAGPQGHPDGRGRAPGGGPRRGRRLGLEPRRPPAGPLPGGRSTCSRRSWRRSRAVRRSTSTAASAAGPTCWSRLALGATAVFTARPLLYALACAGEAGVAHALRILPRRDRPGPRARRRHQPAALRRDHVRVVSSGR